MAKTRRRRRAKRPGSARPCASYFCPHAASHLYSGEEVAWYLEEFERLKAHEGRLAVTAPSTR